MRLAFKDAAVAIKNEGPIAAFYSEGIMRVTGGQFSHVEIVLSEDLSDATCFSALEPIGCRYAVIDLTKPAGMWTVLEWPTTQSQNDFLRGFCEGMNDRPYDSMGIVGIGLETGTHIGYDRFCSECGAQAVNAVTGQLNGIDRWMVAPSCVSDGKRFGLYELCVANGWRKVQ
jgi:hypothetical protein